MKKAHKITSITNVFDIEMNKTPIKSVGSAVMQSPIKNSKENIEFDDISQLSNYKEKDKWVENSSQVVLEEQKEQDMDNLELTIRNLLKYK